MNSQKMLLAAVAIFVLLIGLGCTDGGHAVTSAQPAVDSALTEFIEKIRAVDNHAHVNSVAPADSESDALPLEVLLPFEIPVRLRPGNPDWLVAYKALYKYPYADLRDAHMNELRGTMQGVAKEQGDKFPEWVLEQIGTDVILANRVGIVQSPRRARTSEVETAEHNRHNGN